MSTTRVLSHAALHRRVAARGFSGLVLSTAVLLGLACGEGSSHDASGSSSKVDAASGGDAKRPDAASPLEDAGSAAAEKHFAAATADLTSLNVLAVDGGVIQLGGTASWRATSEGVDLELALHGCDPATAYELSILDALGSGDCAEVASSGVESALGRGLPLVQYFGVGGVAATGHTRSSRASVPWTIGSGSASDLVGRLFVVRDGALGKPLACGVITRSDDVERAPLPASDQPPSIAARATVGGACLGRQFPGSSPRCPDDSALLQCEAVHCEIGRCLHSCEAYANCLDQQGDACASAGNCDPGEDCMLCMAQVQQCAKLFCGEQSFCPATPTPDGPCHQLASCAALQGKAGNANLAALVPLVAELGGDANCIGSMNDWAVVSQWRVPCLFGKSEPPVAPATMPSSGQGGRAPLADDLAGAACSGDTECPGGRCAPIAKQGEATSTGASGYCTTACDNTSDCGRGGKCARSQSAEGKECVAACSEQADCRPGFVCTGALQGSAIVLSGACHPMRQPDQLADHSAGRPCKLDADCSGGSCAETNLLGTSYPGNYCTARCYEDAQCGQGGVCLWTRNSDDLGYCLASCSTDADCTREGYGCWELSDGTRTLHACYPRKSPLPDRRAGQACTVDADCGAPEALCVKQLPYTGLVTNELIDVPGGYCTQHCALDIECGAGAQCLNYGTSGGLCFATCTSEAPCRTGYACFGNGRGYEFTETVCLAPGP